MALMTRHVTAVAILGLIVGACTPAPTPTPAPAPSALTASALSTPVTTPPVERPPTEPPTPVLTPTLACETHAASLELSASVARLEVGEAVTVTATLINEGCIALGLPQFRLYIRSDGPEPILAPDPPEPLVHSLALAPGQSDSADFELRATAAGQAVLMASASFEVHLGYPGPAYWGYTSSPELQIVSVEP
jgi:hypothetical protein